jgi:hypothetical protein
MDGELSVVGVWLCGGGHVRPVAHFFRFLVLSCIPTGQTQTAARHACPPQVRS